MIIPQEIVINRWYVSFVHVVLLFVVEFVLVQFDFCYADVIFAHTDRPKIPPSYPIEIILIIAAVVFI